MKSPSIVRYGGSFIFVTSCVDASPGPIESDRGIFFATTTDLSTQSWTQLVPASGGFSPVVLCTSAPSPWPTDYYLGWYPSLISPSSPPSEVTDSGVVFEMDGCLTGARSIGRRPFTIEAIPGHSVQPKASRTPVPGNFAK